MAVRRRLEAACLFPSLSFQQTPPWPLELSCPVEGSLFLLRSPLVRHWLRLPHSHATDTCARLFMPGHWPVSSLLESGRMLLRCDVFGVGFRCPGSLLSPGKRCSHLARTLRNKCFLSFFFSKLTFPYLLHKSCQRLG